MDARPRASPDATARRALATHPPGLGDAGEAQEPARRQACERVDSPQLVHSLRQLGVQLKLHQARLRLRWPQQQHDRILRALDRVVAEPVRPAVLVADAERQ